MVVAAVDGPVGVVDDGLETVAAAHGGGGGGGGCGEEGFLG